MKLHSHKGCFLCAEKMVGSFSHSTELRDFSLCDGDSLFGLLCFWTGHISMS